MFKLNLQKVSNLKNILLIVVSISNLGLADVLSLEQALDIGLKNNYGLRIQKNSTEKSENNRILGKTSLLPTVDAVGNVGYNWKQDFLDDPASFNGGDTKGYSATAGIAVNWILFDGLRMFKALNLVNQQADLSQVSNRAQVEKTVVQIVASYYNLSSQKKILEISKAQLDISLDRYQRSKNRAEMGRMAQRELLSAEVALNKDSAAIDNQRLALHTAKNQFNILLGREPDIDLDVESEITLSPVDISKEEYIKTALERNSDVEMMEMQIKMAHESYGLNKAAYWPMLIASGGYDLLNASTTNLRNDIVSDIQTGTAKVGLTLQWSLWNGLNDKVAVKNAKLDIQNAEYNLAQYRLQLKSLVLQKWQEVQINFRQSDFNKKALELAEKNLKISQELYNMGKLTGVQFRESQLAFSSAAMTYELSLLQAKIAQTELEQLIGSIKID